MRYGPRGPYGFLRTCFDVKGLKSFSLIKTPERVSSPCNVATARISPRRVADSRVEVETRHRRGAFETAAKYSVTVETTIVLLQKNLNQSSISFWRIRYRCLPPGLPPVFQTGMIPQRTSALTNPAPTPSLFGRRAKGTASNKSACIRPHSPFSTRIGTPFCVFRVVSGGRMHPPAVGRSRPWIRGSAFEAYACDPRRGKPRSSPDETNREGVGGPSSRARRLSAPAGASARSRGRGGSRKSNGPHLGFKLRAASPSMPWQSAPTPRGGPHPAPGRTCPAARS